MDRRAGGTHRARSRRGVRAGRSRSPAATGRAHQTAARARGRTPGRCDPRRHGTLRWCCPCSRTGPAGPRAACISSAALSVNVSARISDGFARRVAISQATRRVMTCVLPVPAPATTSSGPFPCVTARRCSGFRPPSSASSPDGSVPGSTAVASRCRSAHTGIWSRGAGSRRRRRHVIATASGGCWSTMARRSPTVVTAWASRAQPPRRDHAPDAPAGAGAAGRGSALRSAGRAPTAEVRASSTACASSSDSAPSGRPAASDFA